MIRFFQNPSLLQLDQLWPGQNCRHFSYTVFSKTFCLIHMHLSLVPCNVMVGSIKIVLLVQQTITLSAILTSRTRVLLFTLQVWSLSNRACESRTQDGEKMSVAVCQVARLTALTAHGGSCCLGRDIQNPQWMMFQMISCNILKLQLESCLLTQQIIKIYWSPRNKLLPR